MTSYLSANLRQLVIERAGERCEYCLLHQRDVALFNHEVDHIIPEKYQGQTVEGNLALACFECNRYREVISLQSTRLLVKLPHFLILANKVGPSISALKGR